LAAIEKQEKIISEREESVKTQKQSIKQLETPSRHLEYLESSSPSKYSKLGSFAGLKLFEDRIEQSGCSYSLPIQAVDIDVEINGQLYTTTEVSGGDARPTLTRVATGALLGGGLGAAVGMASQKRNPITSKSTVHDTRKGRIEVSGNGLRLTTVFDISKEKQAEDFVTKVWEAKAKYPEALQQRNAEAAEIANDIADTKKQINQNIPLLADAHKELEDLEHNVQLAKDELNRIIDAAPPEQQQAFHRKRRMRAWRTLLVLAILVVGIIVGIAYCGSQASDKEAAAYNQIKGQSWSKALQTLDEAGLDSYDYALQDSDGNYAVPPAGNRAKKYIVKSVDKVGTTKPIITIHLDIPTSVEKLSWEKAQSQLTESGYTLGTDYSLIGTDSAALYSVPDPTNWVVSKVDNTSSVAKIVLSKSATDRTASTTSAPTASSTATTSEEPVTLSTISEWYTDQAQTVCESYAQQLQQQVFKQSLNIETQVSVNLAKGVFDSVNGAYISCDYKTDATYDLTSRFLMTYPDTGSIQLAQASASDLSSKKLFDDNYIKDWESRALTTFTAFKTKYPNGDFKDPYA
jgi:hypothetical protein